MLESDKCRRVIFIDAISCDEALLNISVISKSLTIIDTTSDFNQNKWLGQELGDTLIYFDNDSKPNGLLSLFGCVKAPSTLFLSCHTKLLTDYFKKNILLPQLQSISNNGFVQYQSADLAEQEINQALLKLTGFKKGIIHLIGERGSGKSTLLGRYIASCEQTDLTSILLSSPSRAASQNTFATHKANLKQNHNVSRETIPFSQPHKLLKHLDTAKTIIIDEAATYSKSSITSVIEHVMINDKLLILSTTIEGYEGTGQSYRLNYLNDEKHVVIRLKLPKRFSADDPLYCLTKEIYCPNSNLPDERTVLNDGYHILSTAELRKKGWTAACFALLKQAHYKTTPNDLARFYKDKAIFIIYIEAKKLVGAAHVLHEGLPNNIDTTQIYYGNRRVKNAFTQQALLQAYNNIIADKDNIIKSRILRISRIAVDDDHRRKGIATVLIKKLKQFAIDNQYAYLSTSFSYSGQTLAFWQSQHFIPIRVGLYPNKTNHAYAVIMALGLNDVSRETSEKLNASFRQHIEYFSKSYAGLFALTKFKPVKTTIDQAIEEIMSITEHHRDINWALPILFQHQESIKNNVHLNELFNGCIRKKTTKEQDLARLAEIKQQLINLANQ